MFLVKVFLTLFLLSCPIIFADVVLEHCEADNRVDVEETVLDGKIRSLIWVPEDHKVVYILTDQNTVYKSSDGGRTWLDQTPFMKDVKVPQPYHNQIGVREILVSPKDPKVIFFISWGKNYWRTTDKGDHYDKLEAPGAINGMQLHPTRSDWILMDWWAERCDDVNQPGECYATLYLSQNTGKDWRAIQTYVYEYSWTSAGSTNVAEQTIWSLAWTDKAGNQRLKPTNALTLFHSVDFFQSTIDHGLQQIIYFAFSNHTFYLARASPNGGVTLLVSVDHGKTFRLAKFPFEQLVEKQYQILDDSEGSVFINVRHNNFYWGNLYMSDELGSEYDLSMGYNRRAPNGMSDFTRVARLHGIYIANQLQNVVGDYDTGDGAQTFITFNGGSDWMKLGLPTDVYGKQINCASTVDDCRLHLHGVHKRNFGDIDYFGPLHTSWRAVGLILAVGNVGDYLEFNDKSIIRTYLSRDAGWSWTEIRQGTHIYEFGDHGAILLLADNSKSVNTVSYSWNEGFNFTDCRFTENPIEITTIEADPKGNSQSFIVYGFRNDNGDVKGVVAHFNFSGLHERACVYPDDYESFVPYDVAKGTTDNSARCIMGETISYTRRIRDRECYNGFEYEVRTKPVPCPCTLIDYECDYCFEKIGDMCSLIPGCEVNATEPADCLDFYSVTQGYRLVANNKCDVTKGLNLLPKQFKCSDAGAGKRDGESRMPGGIIVLIIFLILIVIGLVAGVVYFLKFRSQDSSATDNESRYFQWKPMEQPTFEFNEQNTALDEDLLEQKEAEPLDDSVIEEKLSKSSTGKNSELIDFDTV